MNELQIFKNEAFGEIRTTIINGEPWFVAADVCKALDIANPTQAVNRLDEDERSMLNIGRQGETNIVNESGLYSLVLGSRKPEAKQFKRWITHEVIPAIRKYGVYATVETAERLMNDPDFMIRTFTALKEEREKNKALQEKIEQDKPKVLFADAVAASQTSILVGDLAKILKQNGVEIGQKRLFEWLRNNGYLIKYGSSYNMPTQKAMEMKLFDVKESTLNNPDGSIRIIRTVKVTGVGQRYFINKFLCGMTLA